MFAKRRTWLSVGLASLGLGDVFLVMVMMELSSMCAEHQRDQQLLARVGATSKGQVDVCGEATWLSVGLDFCEPWRCFWGGDDGALSIGEGHQHRQPFLAIVGPTLTWM